MKISINANQLILPLLPTSTAHIFYLDVKDFLPEIEQFYYLLSDEEKCKANKFHFKLDKERYILTRGMLRMLLGIYLKSDCKQISFNYNLHDKPYLFNNDVIKFNLSHSKDLILFGFTQQQELGVDLEYSGENLEFDEIANIFFHKNECYLLNEANSFRKKEVFFDIWVIKEAIIKAIGLGLNYNIANIEVSVTKNGGYQIRAISDTALNLSEWNLYLLEINPDYAAAIAIKSRLNDITVNKILPTLNLINQGNCYCKLKTCVSVNPCEQV